MTRQQVESCLDSLAQLIADKPAGAPYSVKAWYTNHRGEKSLRWFVPMLGTLRQLHPSDPETQWHPAGMWVFDVYDLDKNADRTLACEDVWSWEVMS